MKLNRNLNEITIGNLKNGEITLIELNELYNQLGFIFIGNRGKFSKIKKEIKH